MNRFFGYTHESIRKLIRLTDRMVPVVRIETSIRPTIPCIIYWWFVDYPSRTPSSLKSSDRVKRLTIPVKRREDGVRHNAKSCVCESSNISLTVNCEPFKIRAGTNSIGGSIEVILCVIRTNQVRNALIGAICDSCLSSISLYSGQPSTSTQIIC